MYISKSQLPHIRSQHSSKYEFILNQSDEITLPCKHIKFICSRNQNLYFAFHALYLCGKQAAQNLKTVGINQRRAKPKRSGFPRGLSTLERAKGEIGLKKE